MAVVLVVFLCCLNCFLCDPPPPPRQGSALLPPPTFTLGQLKAWFLGSSQWDKKKFSLEPLAPVEEGCVVINIYPIQFLLQMQCPSVSRSQFSSPVESPPPPHADRQYFHSHRKIYSKVQSDKRHTMTHRLN